MVKSLNTGTIFSELKPVSLSFSATQISFSFLVHLIIILCLNQWLVLSLHSAMSVCVCLTQDHQYNWDDGIHRDHRAGLRPASSDKSSQAQNYKNQGRFATIKSASLVRLKKVFTTVSFFFKILKHAFLYFEGLGIIKL